MEVSEMTPKERRGRALGRLGLLRTTAPAPRAAEGRRTAEPAQSLPQPSAVGPGAHVDVRGP